MTSHGSLKASLSGQPDVPPSKRRHVSGPPSLEKGGLDHPPLPNDVAISVKPAGNSRPEPETTSDKRRVEFDTLPKIETLARLTPRENELDSFSRGSSSATAPDEETSLLQSTRILQDPTGRLRRLLQLHPPLLMSQTRLIDVHLKYT